MELKQFLVDFSNQFEETDSSEILGNTKFHDLDEWGSLVSMSVIAMAKIQYGKTITGKEIRECVTVEDLFNLIASK